MIALLLVPSALAAPDAVAGSGDHPRFELSAELGTLANPDRTWDLFSSRDAMWSWGVKAGARLSPRIAAITSWNLARRGSFVTMETDTDGDFEDDTTSFVAAMSAHELTLGAKADVSVGDVFLPYVSAQGLAMIAQMRLDDDPSDRSNPGQLQATGLTGGFLATAGAELRLPSRSRVTAAWYAELGYGWLARASFGDFGTMKPGGLAVRSGIGLRL